MHTVFLISTFILLQIILLLYLQIIRGILKLADNVVVLDCLKTKVLEIKMFGDKVIQQALTFVGLFPNDPSPGIELGYHFINKGE